MKLRIPKIGKQWWHMGLDIPYALPIERFNNDPSAETWESWKIKMLKEHPIRYRIYRTIWDFIYWLLDSQFSWHYRLKWWLLHRFHPEHRYHVLKPRTLKPGYISPSDMILHSAMECLISYMEHEGTRVAWLSDWNHATVYYKMVRIRNWWLNIRPKREIDWGDSTIDHFAIEKVYDDEDNQMLKELIGIRLYLW